VKGRKRRNNGRVKCLGFGAATVAMLEILLDAMLDLGFSISVFEDFLK